MSILLKKKSEKHLISSESEEKEYMSWVEMCEASWNVNEKTKEKNNENRNNNK